MQAQVAFLSANTRGKRIFALSKDCLACHNALIAPSGTDVSIGDNWRASMMAHSALDPYWQASVRRETDVRPTAAKAIQDECAACHMPKARYNAKTSERHGAVFEHMPGATPLPKGQAPTRTTQLARDGVSCSMCHQIEEEKLGTDASFTAGFVVDTSTPIGQRQLFGPFDVDAGRTQIMRSATQFEPHRSTHVQDSALCASCHTLYTHARDQDGKVVGTLPEQVPYLEWLHSDYPGRESCQDCHMPVVQKDMPITAVIGERRPQLSRHVFRGGNFLMLDLLGTHRKTLGVTAPATALAASRRRTQRHLETSTCSLTLAETDVSERTLRVTVALKNLAGHKLPTAYPSRRVWLHLTVRDSDERVMFESGALNPDGSIGGNDNDADPKRYEPHHKSISSSDDVQIYEAIMATPGGAVTTVLLSAIRFIKNNRLLPNGFSPETAHDDIAVQGQAKDDQDFRAGGDHIRYVIDLGDATPPYTVTAELWYQPIAFRWAQNLLDQPSAETKRFVRYYDGASGDSGVILAEGAATLR